MVDTGEVTASIAAVVLGIGLLVVSVLYANKLRSEKITDIPVGDPTSRNFMSSLVMYMPNVLLVYGFIADIISQKYKYSVASFTAIIGMIVNKYLGGHVVSLTAAAIEKTRQLASNNPLTTAAVGAVGMAAAAPAVVAAAPAVAAAATAAAPVISTAAAAAPAAAMAAAPIVAPAAAAAAATTVAAASMPELPDIKPISLSEAVGSPPPMSGGAVPCSLPGFDWLENSTAPQGIVLSMTVLFYFLIQMWDTGLASQSIALGVTTAITFGLQWYTMAKNGCLANYTYPGMAPIIALIMAITFAGTSYGINKLIPYYASASASSSGVPPSKDSTGVLVCPKGYVMNYNTGLCEKPMGPGGNQQQDIPIQVGEKSGDTSAPVDDNDQFVCEAYKDGELVTSTIVE